MSLITKTDVTAVILIQNEILAGIGSYIHVYNKETGKILHRIRALNCQKIYGFSLFLQDNEFQKILIIGGKQFAIASWDSKTELKINIQFDGIVCDDWIHCGAWFREHSGHNAAVVLTAHNSVQKWDIDTQSILSVHTSIENSLLYSGVLVPLQDDLLVVSGTVYSEVLVRLYRNETSIFRLKGHRGVILSIACNLQKGLIVTTSDDRSVRIWGPSICPDYSKNTKLYWENVQMDCKHDVYGHSARVMRCALNNDIIASVGEDSKVCIWNLQGKLIEKKPAHQNGPIWSINIDEHNNVVTGGGDGSIILHPKSSINYQKEENKLDLNIDTPKKIIYTARNKIAILTKDEIIYYDEDLKMVSAKFKINFESTYILMDISSCKQLIAVCDMIGNFNMFIENCKGEPCLKNIIQTKFQMGKILSMHWVGNRHLIVCCNEGNINLLAANAMDIDVHARFILPHCKERWLTSCAFDSSQKLLIVGDRCGNIHFYNKGITNPLKTFNKVHGLYGPTSLKINNNEIISTGRDGTAKYFHFNEGENIVKYITSKDVTFAWVERLIDRSPKYICGFRERAFVVYDMVNNAEILEVPCGGGHRPWDAVKYIERTADGFREYIKIVFLKSPEIFQFKYNIEDMVSKHINQGTHTKEINCLDTIKCSFDPKTVVNISGGEDTTLRATIFKRCQELQSNNIENANVTEEILCKHLSNIRTLKTYRLTDDKYLVVSAGGRAQICVNIIEILQSEADIHLRIEQLTNHMIKGTDKERKGNKPWKEHIIDFDPETRIMDIDIKEIDKNLYNIFAGCSDMYLRIFELNLKSNSKETIKLLKEIKYHETCILKVLLVNNNQIDILISCTTRGIVAFWDTNLLTNSSENDIKPFFATQCNQAGINSLDIKIISVTMFMLATGGDDNALHLNKILFDKYEAKIQSNVVINNWHSSQITGIKFVDDNLLLCTSIDQRVTLCKWWMDSDKLQCTFLRQYCSDVADIHGISIVENLKQSVMVCVFGKGYEVISVSKEIDETDVK